MTIRPRRTSSPSRQPQNRFSIAPRICPSGRAVRCDRSLRRSRTIRMVTSQALRHSAFSMTSSATTHLAVLRASVERTGDEHGHIGRRFARRIDPSFSTLSTCRSSCRSSYGRARTSSARNCRRAPTESGIPEGGLIRGQLLLGDVGRKRARPTTTTSWTASHRYLITVLPTDYALDNSCGYLFSVEDSDPA